jgi:hypothetical protein
MYKVYYKNIGGFFRVYNGVSIATEPFLPIHCNAFYLTKGYTADDKSLIQYYSDIKVASEELKASYELKGFDYLKEKPYKDEDKTFYRTHQSNIVSIFRMKANPIWKDWEAIDITEAKWYKMSANGPLQYCQPGEYNAFGYDFNIYYPRLMGDKRFSDLQIPTTGGTEYTLTDLTSIKYGFYRVKLTCNDPNISKIFSFSKDNVYTHYSLNFAYELIKKHNFNIDIELIQDGEPNAYLYQETSLITSNSLFNNWFACILNIKKKYPKNILVKMLSSSVWGHLSQKNTITVSGDKIDDYDIDVGDDAKYKIMDIIIKEDNSEYYKLLNTQEPYKLQIRLKPFLTSYGRNKTARVALRMIDSVIRIHTDGICFNKPYTVKSENLLPEKKTTGHIKFNNINSYERL